MKLNYWLIFLTGMHSFLLCSHGKITQMIYAESQYNPYESEEEMPGRTIIYYLADNKLYMQDITDASNKTTHEMDLYQFKDKKNQKKWEINDEFFDLQDRYEEDFEKINMNIMHIGKPMYFDIKKNDSRWIMPIVTKEKWLLGNLFRTDLCVIVQKQVKESTEATEFEMRQIKTEKKQIKQERTIYFLKKIDVGHRAPTNFVGFWNVSNIYELGKKQGWAILSSSTWPTIKWRFLKTDEKIKELKNDEFVLDSQSGRDGFILIAKKYTQTARWTKKTKVKTKEWIEQLTLYTKEKNGQDKKVSQSIKNLFPPVLFYPSITIDPAFFLNKPSESVLKDIITNHAHFLEKISELENKNIISKQVKIYLRPENNKTLIIPENDLYSNITVFNKDANFKLGKNPKKYIVTSSVYDFKEERLFLGIYDRATKKSFIKTFVMQEKSSSSSGED